MHEARYAGFFFLPIAIDVRAAAPPRGIQIISIFFIRKEALRLRAMPRCNR